MSLHTHLVGTGRPRVAFLHGLFGQGRNWTTIAHGLTPEFTSVLLDLPNHGHSGWTDSFDYVAWADLVAEDITERLGSAARLSVVGHSLGGKVAMLLALRHPHLVRSLAVVDIAPDSSSHGHSMGQLIGAMQSLDLARLTSRAQADALLASKVPDPDVRGFLLQNLHRRHQAFAWRMNLPMLAEALPAIFGWPAGVEGHYDGPVLWLCGDRSEYVRPEHEAPMRALFPGTHRVNLPAGHWVHADAPDQTIAVLRESLETT